VVYSPSTVLLIDRSGVGFRFEADGGAQLVDRGAGGQLRVVLVGSVGRRVGDHLDLIQGEAPVTHTFCAAREHLEPPGHGDYFLGVVR
jgi:hypothetical protein